MLSKSFWQPLAKYLIIFSLAMLAMDVTLPLLTQWERNILRSMFVALFISTNLATAEYLIRRKQ
jgi:hypothetical protein